MNLLILGSGGREHALAWKLAQSSNVKRLFIAPGNAGTSLVGTNLPVDISDFTAVKNAVKENNIEMVLVGPEVPLVAGIVDFFRDDSELQHIPVIGPDKSAARLEGSKDFAKGFLVRNGIPTARYKSFEKSSLNEVGSFLKTLKPPYVLKADGLAAGKGVVILDSFSEALKDASEILNGKFGEAGSKLVIEEFLDGIELSVFIITDGISYKLLPEAKDYKRIGEGNMGPNTGGMGAVSPVPFARKIFMQKVKNSIIEPTMSGLRKEGINYKGFIFFGLINVGGDPYVIEYNARLGDPETEVIIPRIKSDLFDLLQGVANGDLSDKVISTDPSFVTTVMMVSGGYPYAYEKGKEISGLETTSDCMVFHAGTAKREGKVITAGGRVLAVSAIAPTMREALEQSYKNASRISFEKANYRKDIGFDL